MASSKQVQLVTEVSMYFYIFFYNKDMILRVVTVIFSIGDNIWFRANIPTYLPQVSEVVSARDLTMATCASARSVQNS